MSLGAKGRATDEDRGGRTIDLLHEEGAHLLSLLLTQLLLVDDMDMCLSEGEQQRLEGLLEELGVLLVEAQDRAQYIPSLLALILRGLYRGINETT